MRNPTGIPFLVFFTFILVVTACSSEDSDWRAVKESGSVVELEQFLSKHPDGEFSGQANARIELLRFEEAKGEQSIEAMAQFLEHHPDSSFADAARLEVESIRFAEAESKEKVAAFIEFLTDYPEGNNAERARNLLSTHKALLAKRGKGAVVVETSIDNYGRTGSETLKNGKSKPVARRFYQFDGLVPVGRDLIDLSNDRTVITTRYDEYGKPVNDKWVCLDYRGNLLRDTSNKLAVNATVVVDKFDAHQKSSTSNLYEGAFMIGKHTRIYPCLDCSEKTGNPGCFYVW